MDDKEVVRRLWEVLAPDESIGFQQVDDPETWRTDALIVLDEDDQGIGAVSAVRMDLADTVSACWFSGTSEWKGFKEEDNRTRILTVWKRLLGEGFSAVCQTLPDRWDHTREGETPQAVLAFDAAASAWALDAERFLRMYEAVPYTAMPGWGYRTNRTAVYNYTNTAPGSIDHFGEETWFNQEEFNRQVAARRPAAPAADPAGTAATQASRRRKTPTEVTSGQDPSAGLPREKKTRETDTPRRSGSHSDRMLAPFPQAAPRRTENTTPTSLRLRHLESRHRPAQQGGREDHLRRQDRLPPRLPRRRPERLARGPGQRRILLAVHRRRPEQRQIHKPHGQSAPAPHRPQQRERNPPLA
ncbi:hypothetical protein OHV05_35215 (plasmid) [Kitasatospora sp. NBC_00070]|uniref:hypothetical protein n=1 Tax=Kitasatospora sp. NBC_00070 TaxID=2975962 RepID=UPI002F915657